MKKRCGWILAAAAVLLAGTGPAPADEGMWPVSEIPKLDLRTKGLEMTPEDIFSPDRASLIFGIVSLGATGSFVSPEGLMITNHHVAFGAAQAASTPERNYIRDGFLARTRAEEVEAKGMTARITESFEDVSPRVLAAAKPGLPPAERRRAVERRMKEIVAEAEKKHPGKRAEVAEMFAGKSYVLFLYTYLRDIRLVYVPPRSIGEFGGEEDNWMWPRHTGDFSFLRAYTGPEGEPADISPRNIPFRPRRFLQVAAGGAAENDFVFLLGYPGRTSRHAFADYLAYEEDVRMPYVADWYAWQIGLLEKRGEEDPALALRHSARIKGLANTMKNFRGKLQGMKRLGLVAAKREEEKVLQTFIEADPARKAASGGLLAKATAVYADMRRDASYRFVLNYLRSHVGLLSFASTVHEAAVERGKPDLEREPAYMDRNFPQTRKRLELGLQNFDEGADRAILKELLLRAARLPEKDRFTPLASVFAAPDLEKAVDATIAGLYGGSKLADAAILSKALGLSPEELTKLRDPALELAAFLYPLSKEIRKREDGWAGTLDPLAAELIDLKAARQARAFVPDANNTLRLTYGRVKGYRPRDAVFYGPFTTLDGVAEKTTGREPFDTPPALLALRRAGDFGRYKPAGFPSVPTCLLYDTDTTGGNSGSPVLNARGELVGVNFDRTYEATINDYAWNADYSRSIGVDIRYVLWVTEKFAGADFLLKEMNVPPSR
jgi:hypothetical protein